MDKPNEAAREAPACWQFAHVRVDEAQGRVWVRGGVVPLGRSELALLSHLIRHAGETVHKDALLAVGWPGRVVAENTLAKAVSKLRHAIDDEHGELLRVVHGYGYRLAAQVAQVAAETPAAVPVPAVEVAAAAPPVLELPPPPARATRSRPGRRLLLALVPVCVVGLLLAWWVRAPVPAGAAAASSATAVAPPNSIAVLPFADLSPKRDQGYFADGLAEELLDHLARLGQLRVAARTSSFALRDSKEDVRAIGRQLGVRHVLEGSVRSSGDRLRVTVQLIDVGTGFHAWSQTYDRPIGELFEMQDDIVVRIVEAMRIELAPAEIRELARHGTRNPQAFREYLLGRAIYQDDETAGRRSMLAYRRAVALDPDFFEAWHALALALNFDAVYPDSTEEVLANKREALEIMQRLIRLRPRQADLYRDRGDMLFWHWHDLAAAERDFEHAARLGLRDDTGWMVRMSRLYAATGRMPEALALTARLDARDPASSGTVVRAYHLLASGRHDEARAAALKGLRWRPLDEHAHYYLGLSDLLQGRPEAAMAHFDQSSHLFRLTGRAMAEWALGNRAASDQHLQRLAERYGHMAPYQVAEVHAWRGEPDASYRWMQRSVEVRDGSLMYLAFDPLIAGLRKDPRWPALLRQVGLAGYLLPGHAPAVARTDSPAKAPEAAHGAASP